MNIVIIGSGGREAALAHSITHSKELKELYVLPGNPFIDNLATCVDIAPTNFTDIISFCKEHAVDLVIVGPELPLAHGLVNTLTAQGIVAFGPTKEAARLETSKLFTKEICRKYDIPTARYAYFTDPVAAKRFVYNTSIPIVIKLNGLAAGKGVTICFTAEQACSTLDAAFTYNKKETILIEEFLEGIEISYFALVSKQTIVKFTTAQDYKKIYYGTESFNTGGMGAYSPYILDTATEEIIAKRIIHPTIQGLYNDFNTSFQGILYAGLILTKDGPKLLEYNVRFGDPEIQAILPHLKGDIVPILYQVATNTLTADRAIEFTSQHTVCVVIANKGYPLTYESSVISADLQSIAKKYQVNILHAGTKYNQNKELLACGGRVLNVVATEDSREKARIKAYQAIKAIAWPNAIYREDIGTHTFCATKSTTSNLSTEK